MKVTFLYAILFSFAMILPAAELPDTEKDCMIAYHQQNDVILRRHAYRKLLQIMKNNDALIREGLADTDALIRKKALYELFMKKGDNAVSELKKMAFDTDSEVALLAVDSIANLKDKRYSTKLITKIAKNTKDPLVAKFASGKTFQFHRNNIRLSERKDWDFEIVKVKTIAIPLENWRFTVDPGNMGHLKNYWQEKFDTSSWREQKMGYWRNQGFNGYVGYGWYRIPFKMPVKIDSNAVELNFFGVEESTWVWLNGIYIGSHDEGAAGWDKPFSLDVTKEIRWDADNILVVRVKTDNMDGGIYKPIAVDVLK
ncbi:MAG: hypothetical protein PHX61_11665 [Alphaproteobacteria bacterium]|nr:hypothetical protein [Alphaproteobacteria bacterium]